MIGFVDLSLNVFRCLHLYTGPYALLVVFVPTQVEDADLAYDHAKGDSAS